MTVASKILDEILPKNAYMTSSIVDFYKSWANVQLHHLRGILVTKAISLMFQITHKGIVWRIYIFAQFRQSIREHEIFIPKFKKNSVKPKIFLLHSRYSIFSLHILKLKDVFLFLSQKLKICLCYV